MQAAAQVDQLNTKIQAQDWTRDINYRDDAAAATAAVGDAAGLLRDGAAVPASALDSIHPELARTLVQVAALPGRRDAIAALSRRAELAIGFKQLVSIRQDAVGVTTWRDHAATPHIGDPAAPAPPGPRHGRGPGLRGPGCRGQRLWPGQPWPLAGGGAASRPSAARPRSTPRRPRARPTRSSAVSPARMRSCRDCHACHSRSATARPCGVR